MGNGTLSIRDITAMYDDNNFYAGVDDYVDYIDVYSDGYQMSYDDYVDAMYDYSFTALAENFLM